MMVEVKGDFWTSFTNVNQKCKNILTWHFYAKDWTKLLLNDKKEHEVLNGFLYNMYTQLKKQCLLNQFNIDYQLWNQIKG